MMVLGVVGLTTFTSCEKDDDKKPVIPTLSEVNGTYSGKMTYTLITPEGKMDMKPETPETEAITVNAKISNNDTITFEKFPIDALITAVVGEANAPGIIKAVGDVTYKVGFKAAFNEAKDSISLDMDPKPLLIKYAIGEGENAFVINVNVAIVAETDGSYALKGKNLKFNLSATKATLNDEEENVLPGIFSLSFDMKK